MNEMNSPPPTNRADLVEEFAQNYGDGIFVPCEVYDAQQRPGGELMLVMNTYASKTLHYVTYVGKFGTWREVVPSSFRVPELALNELFRQATEKGVDLLREGTRLVGVRSDNKVANA